MNDKPNGTGEEKRAPKRKKALWIVGIVALVLVVAAIGYAIWERPPETVPPAPTSTPAPTAAQPVAEVDDPETTEPPEQIDEPDPDALVTDREPGKYTILLVGRDYISNSTDTIIVARLDTKQHSIECVSIPRDTLINSYWASTPKKINAVYPGYVAGGENGAEGLKTHLRNLLGFDIDCYTVVNIQAMEQAVDTIGGVWFDVPQDMDYDDPTQNLYIHLKAGYQLLNGEDAVKLCRYRSGYSDADIGRIHTQQAFLKTLASQMLSLGNIPNLGTLVDILTENVETDLTAANVAWFARQFLACKLDDIHFSTLPYSNLCSINGVSYVSVDQDAWLEMVNSCLNPYVEPVTSANVSLLMSDYTGALAWSNTGTVAGGMESFYCLSCTVKNGGRPVCHYPDAHLAFAEEPAAETTE